MTPALCRRLARLGALVAFAAGAVALLGWVLGADLLKSVVVGQVTMKVNTAICLMGAGGALWALTGVPAGARAVAGRALALAFGLLAAAVLSQYVTGRDLGIDQWLFFEPPGAAGTLDPNRMAPNTAVCLMLVSAALVLLDAPMRRQWPPAPLLAGVSGALALFALAGYMSGVTSLYGSQDYTQMAVPTSVAFIGLSLGVFLARPDQAPMSSIVANTPGAAALRRLVPAIVVLPTALGALRLGGEEAGLYPTVVGAWLLVVGMIALALPLAWRLARSLDNADGDRRQAEALRGREERARRIVDTAYDAFVAVGADGRVQGWNEAAERLFGYPIGEAMGSRLTSLVIPPRLQAAHVEAFGRAAALAERGQPIARRATETTARHRDGREFPVELITAVGLEPGGVVFHAFLRDITERRRAHDELADAQREVLHRLALAAEYRDDDTGEHTRRVGDLCARLATRVGLPDADVELLRHAAPLHDVGKIGIPDAILLKPGGLTKEEFDTVKTHTVIGAQMLAGRGFPMLELAEEIALTHHERWDGSGYPHGRAGEDIPIAGRIVALADVFDALTHDRPYKKAWTVDEALAEIAGQSGRQFDPALVEAFVELVAEEHGRPRAAAAPARTVAV